MTQTQNDAHIFASETIPLAEKSQMFGKPCY